ncbi:MAG TPA: futalosine hydrolase [Jatrophihabitans sp.]|nr:futalosine hydrolase [Jatrophihabitans sp.]
MSKILIVTAVAAERDAILANRHSEAGRLAELPVQRCQTGAGLVEVICGGVGAVAAALSTAAVLGQQVGYQLVIAAGIGGGFGPAVPGSVVVADAVVQADLGAETADGGFCPLAELGWGEVRFGLDPGLTAELAHRAEARTGAVLTVSTVTGTAARAEALHSAHPDALAEAMEGAGVYQAAQQAGIQFAELRAISNRVGPRDRDSWQIPAALAALGRTFDQILAQPLTRTNP